MDRSIAPLDFTLWNVQPATVEDNLRRFRGDTGIQVDARIVDGAYHHILGAEFAQGQGPDVFYAQRAEAALWGAEGHILGLDPDHTALAPVIAGMDPRLVAGACDADGGLLGLTYYNGGPFALFLRDGLTAPRTWRGFLDLMRRCKHEGLSDHPFVPRWHQSQTGLIWSLLCHLSTEGVQDLTEAGAAEVVAEILSIWAALLAEDLVPSGSLDDTGDQAAVTRWASGAHCATFTMDYLADDVFRLAGRALGVPVALPGSNGTALMPGHALLCVRAGLSGPRLEQALALMAWLGGPQVHARWYSAHFFPVAFPVSKADVTAAERVFPPTCAPSAVARIMADRAHAVTSPVTQDRHALDWTAVADTQIRAALRDPAADLDAAAQRVVEDWHRRHPL
ncbi:extracellular solute-binding protein [Pseudoruegeria sp. SK021]|uniref:extracellular solute-binding protein n=1 Tax=Pseudoruegeria sp. SK021 TaxID=1933035 RepID=UPI000A245F25|nr:extracellular solute-binding protein [Pseudoruegeria sp. SK021]OSP54711.1 hypothetical protein BV911_11140 [Pseudoruegeria sp. SK021]